MPKETCLLLSEPAYERLHRRLHNLSGRLTCLVMEGDGRTRPTEGTSAGGKFQCAYLSGDVFMNGEIGSWFDAFAAAPTLEWVQSAGAGIDHPIFAALVSRDVRLTTSHAQAIGVAEYVLWGVLDHFQQGRRRDEEQAGRRWVALGSRELRGSHWLIVGFGSIGEAVARLAGSFGAKVTGVRRTPGTSPLADHIIAADQIHRHLPQADVVVLCVPNTTQTANLVDETFLKAMKSRAVLVNVGRGGLVDEDALLRALDAGRPEYAILDVFRCEPLPADSRFWHHPRVKLTAHCAASSENLEARTDDLLIDNLRRFLDRETLLNEVTQHEVLAVAGS